MPLVLDAGGVSRLARRDAGAVALIRAFDRAGVWPPIVPSVVLVECLTGRSGADVLANRLLRACDIRPTVAESLARRAAALRTQAGRGSAVDALVVAVAEPGGTVLTSDLADIRVLADHATGVNVERA